jgi:hypothetical protein
MAKKPSGGPRVLRFTIKAVGPPRTEKQMRADVSEALDEAVKKYKSRTSKKDVSAHAEPEGAFTGIELAAWWLLKTFGAGVIGGAGGAAGKKIFGYLSTCLRKRNLDPGPATFANSDGVKEKPKRRGGARKKKS